MDLVTLHLNAADPKPFLLDSEDVFSTATMDLVEADGTRMSSKTRWKNTAKDIRRCSALFLQYLRFTNICVVVQLLISLKEKSQF